MTLPMRPGEPGSRSTRERFTLCEKAPVEPNSTMGFMRHQEERLAVRFLVWQCQRMNLVVPPHSELQRRASKIVDEAHRIARETGGNVISIMKELIKDLKKQ